MKLQGRKIYIACIVLIVLALCQWRMRVEIPKEIWYAVFGLIIIALRKVIGASELKTLALLLVPAALLCGCAGPAPVPVKGGISILCWYAPQTTFVVPGGTSTNVSDALVSRDADSQPIQPAQSGICFFQDNLVTINNGGGTASSNNVPVSFSFSKQ